MCGVIDLEEDFTQVDLEETVDLNSLPKEHFIKLLVLGDLGVGKTSLLKNYTSIDSKPNAASNPIAAHQGVENINFNSPQFDQETDKSDYKVSVDVGYHLKRLDIDDKQKVTIQLWDIPGHERFGGMTKVYYKYAHGALIVFDLARPETFDAALSWLSDVTEKLFDEKKELLADQSSGNRRQRSQSATSSSSAEEANRPMPVVLIANKCDLPALKVPRHKYSSYVSENGLLSWFETSSKDSTSIAHSVQRLVEYILETDPAFKPLDAQTY